MLYRRTPTYTVGYYVDEWVIKPIGKLFKFLFWLAIIFGIVCIPIAAIKYLFFS